MEVLVENGLFWDPPEVEHWILVFSQALYDPYAHDIWGPQKWNLSSNSKSQKRETQVGLAKHMHWSLSMAKMGQSHRICVATEAHIQSKTPSLQLGTTFAKVVTAPKNPGSWRMDPEVVLWERVTLPETYTSAGIVKNHRKTISTLLPPVKSLVGALIGIIKFTSRSLAARESRKCSFHFSTSPTGRHGGWVSERTVPSTNGILYHLYTSIAW